MMIQVISGTLAAYGRSGDQYIIPVKGFDGKRLPLPMVEYFCRVFLDYARARFGDDFTVMASISGGYKPAQIAPFFDHCPRNIFLPYEFMY
jgi:hypothetical protein